MGGSMRKILLGFVLVLFFVKNVSACSIGIDPKNPPTPKSEFDAATVVFLGEFQSAREIEIPIDSFLFSIEVEATFKMKTVYKGFYRAEDRLVKIRSGMGGGDCGISGLLSEKKGARWLVYAHLITNEAGEVQLFTSITEPTSQLQDVEKKYLDFLKTIKK